MAAGAAARVEKREPFAFQPMSEEEGPGGQAGRKRADVVNLNRQAWKHARETGTHKKDAALTNDGGQVN